MPHRRTPASSPRAPGPHRGDHETDDPTTSSRGHWWAAVWIEDDGNDSVTLSTADDAVTTACDAGTAACTAAEDSFAPTHR